MYNERGSRGHAMKRLFCLVLICLASTLNLALGQSGSAVPPYKDSSVPVEQRVQDLLGRMTLQEKVAMLAGADWMQSVPNERLGIPSIRMSDGPLGIRSWSGPSSEMRAEDAKEKDRKSTRLNSSHPS